MDKVTELSLNNGYLHASQSSFCCNTTGCNIDTLPGKNTHLVKFTSSQLSNDGLVWERQRLIFIRLRRLLFNDMVVNLCSGQPSVTSPINYNVTPGWMVLMKFCNALELKTTASNINVSSFSLAWNPMRHDTFELFEYFISRFPKRHWQQDMF